MVLVTRLTEYQHLTFGFGGTYNQLYMYVILIAVWKRNKIVDVAYFYTMTRRIQGWKLTRRSFQSIAAKISLHLPKWCVGCCEAQRQVI